MINAAIVGLGRWGKNMVNAVQGKSERLRFIRGVVRHPEAVRDFAEQHDFELSSDLAGVLADPAVQAVVFATPHSLHVEQIVAAAAARKPVLCEKPLALTRADAERAVTACKKAGVPLAVGHDKRFMASMLELQRVVASGVLGEILHIEANSSNEVSRVAYSAWRESPAESPGGSMTATGVHLVDACVNLVGPLRRVQAQLMPRRPPPDVRDTVSVLLEFDNRATGVLCSVRPTPYFWRAHVFGANGSAEAIGPDEFVLRLSGAKPQRQTFDMIDTLRSELDAFADAAAGRAPYPITPAQIVDTIAAFEAIVNSMNTGAPALV